MDDSEDMATHGGVPQASYHIEVSSADGSTPPAEQYVTEPVLSPPASGGTRSVVLVRAADSDQPSPEARSVKYVLTGLHAAHNGAGVGILPVKSPAVPTAGQTTSAARARQILRRRLELSQAEKKYTKMLHPDLSAAEAEGSTGAEGGPSAPTPVMICEPEPAGGGQGKQGRTFFFVAKPPDVAVKEELQAVTENVDDAPNLLPDGPAQSDVPVDDMGVLKRLARYKLSERYEILPAASLDDAEEIMHRLRMQNLALKTEMVRQATEYERHGDEHGLRGRRGRKKATTIVAVDRLRELEKIEAGMHTLFTPSQVKALSRDYKKNSVQWRDEDFRRALGLLEHSSQYTFNYVRKVMNLPLPSIGTLKLRCPQQPELHVRLEAALQERGNDARCKQCSRRVSAAAAAAGAQGGGDGGEEGDLVYQVQEDMPAIAGEESGQQQQEPDIQWMTHETTPSRGVLKRKRSSSSAARKAMHQDEEVVFYEAPVPTPSARGRGRRPNPTTPASSSSTPRGRGGRGRGRGRGLVTHYEPPPPPPQEEDTIIDDDEEDDDEEEPEDEEDFEEEFGEEVEIDPEQQEVPTQEYTTFRNSYEAGGSWNEWDPRQLH